MTYVFTVLFLNDKKKGVEKKFQLAGCCLAEDKVEEDKVTQKVPLSLKMGRLGLVRAVR